MATSATVSRENPTPDAAETWEARRERVVGAARAQVVQLRNIELEQSRLRLAKAGELVALEASTGDDVLDELLAGDGAIRTRQVAESIAIARAELGVIDQAIDAARRRRERAIRGVHEQDAGALFARAAELRGEALSRESRTAELLAALEAWEDCRYAPAEPERPSRLVDAAERLTAVVGLASQEAATVPAFGPVIVYRPTPLTVRIRTSAVELEGQARAIASRDVVRAGSVEADSVEDLVELVLGDEMRIGPTVGAIVTWAAGASAAAVERLEVIRAKSGEETAREAGLGRPLRWSIGWTDGEIDPRRSGARPALAE